MIKSILVVLTLCLSVFNTFSQEQPLKLSDLPQVVYSPNPEFEELYNKAWQLALEHIKYQKGLPQELYVDEAFDEKTVWIWDTAFMLLFYKYGATQFPAIKTFNNFYAPIHDGTQIPIRIEIPDNPPLFAWTEYEFYKLSNDKDHIKNLIYQKQYLQKHFHWMDTIRRGSVIANSAPTCIKKDKNGYLWEGGRSGMDNTVRGRKGKHARRQRPNNPDMLWVDALAQQGLSALYISKLYEELGDIKGKKEWIKRYKEIKKQINSCYWCEDDGIYYDINRKNLEHMKIKTPASYWPMLAEMCSKKQAEEMKKHILDEHTFGGFVPWTTLARDDSDFSDNGRYWRGSVWLPTAYMGIKSLEKYEYFDLARESAYKIVNHMSETYKNYSPHTIWECYDPDEPKPAISEHGKVVRPDFCGWSALGPISLLVENIIGIYDVDATNKTVKWNLNKQGKQGVKNLRFGDVTTDLIYHKNKVTIKSNKRYKLIINNKKYNIKQGENIFTLN